MQASRNHCIAIIFISLLAGNEAYLIQRTVATTRAAASMALLFSAMGMRINRKQKAGENTVGGASDLLESMLERMGSQQGKLGHTCNSDITLDLTHGDGQHTPFRVRSDQYRDAGEEGFVFATKQQELLSCFETYAITCVNGAAAWRMQKHLCLTMIPSLMNPLEPLPRRDDTVEVKPFGSLTDRWQAVSASSEEQIFASRYMPRFPKKTTYIKVVPAELTCPQLISEAESAETELSAMLSGMCQSGGNSTDEANNAGSCAKNAQTTPPIDKFARKLNSFMSAKAAVKRQECGSVGPGDMKTSPLIKSLKELYAKMMSKKVSSEQAPLVMDGAIEALTGIAQKCEAGKQCAPSGPETSDLIAILWSGTNKAAGISSAETAKAQAQADAGQTDATAVTAEELVNLAKKVEEDPGKVERDLAAMMSNSSSMLETDAESRMDFMTMLAWGVGIASVLFFLYLLLALVAAVFVFIGLHFFTIIFVLTFGFAILVGLMKLLCGPRGLSNEGFACMGSRGHYVAKADRLGIPRYLVGRI